MSNTKIAIITLGILYAGNILALIYTWLVLYTNVFKKYRLQDKPYKPGIFFERLPLILLNLAILSVITGVTLYFFADLIFETSIPRWWLIPVQVIFIFIIDDAWFYFAHRLMHENKYLLRKIHNIHHRAITPFPLEYIYVHPLEWMLGSVGTFLGIGAWVLFMPGEVNVYAFFVYGAIRNLHEVDIHSDLRSPITKYIPFLNPAENHDLHHSKVKGNYASMFNFWDKIFGTTLTKD